MFKTTRKILLIAVAIVFALGAAGCGSTQEAEKEKFPTKPIQMTVPYQAGDASDLSARVIADQFASVLSQPMVVVNKAGGGGSIGATEVAGAKPDGYSLLQGSHGLITAKPYLDKVGYTPESFKPVAQVIEIPIALGVRKDSPFKTLKDLVNYAKENPGKVKYSIPGTGTDKHVTMEDFCSKVGVKMTVVPYQGGTQAMTALLSKDVDVAVVGAPVLTGQYKSGDIKVIGITSKDRVDYMSDGPTFKEQGYDMVAATWFGMLAPKDTPDDVVKALDESIKKIMAKPEVQQQLKKMDMQPAYLSSKDFAALIKSDAERNQRVLKAIGMIK